MIHLLRRQSLSFKLTFVKKKQNYFPYQRFIFIDLSKSNMANGINSIRKGKKKQGTKSMGFRTKAKPTWPNLKTNGESQCSRTWLFSLHQVRKREFKASQGKTRNE